MSKETFARAAERSNIAQSEEMPTIILAGNRFDRKRNLVRRERMWLKHADGALYDSKTLKPVIYSPAVRAIILDDGEALVLSKESYVRLESTIFEG